MKKNVICAVVALLLGAILGKLTFDQYQNLEVQTVANINDSVYAVKYGTYQSEDEMAKKVTKAERYIFINKNGKISTYVGISTSEKNANKIKKIYDAKGLDLKVEKIKIDNDEFIQNLNEYEKLLDATDDEKSLLIIQNQILSCYEQLVIKDE